MKTLSTSDQNDLQSFIQGLKDNTSINWNIEEQGFLSYWAIELKPKRVRKKNIMGDQGTSCIKGDGGTRFIDGGTTFVENSVDNTPEV